MEETTAFQDLKKAVREFPEYIVGYFVGFLVYILNQTEITTIALFGATIGTAVGNFWWGIAAFLGTYIGARSVNSVGDAIVHAAHVRSQQL